MYCKNCGKEISDDAMFCSYCGTKQEVVENETAANQATKKHDTHEMTKLAEIIMGKTLLFPVSATRRIYQGFFDWNFDIFSDAVYLGRDMVLEHEDVIKSLAQSIVDDVNCNEFLLEKAHKYYEFAIKEALKDVRAKKTGDLYLILVGIGGFGTVVKCIVKITGMLGKYEYIAGIICQWEVTQNN